MLIGDGHALGGWCGRFFRYSGAAGSGSVRGSTVSSGPVGSGYPGGLFILVVFVFSYGIAGSAPDNPSYYTPDNPVAFIDDGTGGSTRTDTNCRPFRLWTPFLFFLGLRKIAY
jgi:hypothetical protein